MAKKSLNETKFTYENLYSLLYKEDFLYQALINLKNNDGISTPGIDNRTLDSFSKINMEALRESLKNRSYRFKPVRKIFIPKPGKSELRPLGIPTLEDRIVQEMIRIILEAIYEPIFEVKHKNSNFGFRKNKSTHDAINKITTKAQNTEWCIEGDIKGAFNNVDHDILCDILSERISDKEFIQFIKQGLRSGSVHQGNYEHTVLGTPQGGIASPILFNIYLSKLDEYILTEVQAKIDEINISQKRTIKPVTRSYRKHESQVSSAIISIAKIRKKQTEIHGPFVKNWDKEQVKKMRLLILRRKRDKKMILQTPYLDKKRATLRIVYVRYADDWTLFLNGNEALAYEIKTMISEFLLNKLKLTLSEDKTFLTNVKKNRVYFLGYSLCYYADAIRVLNRISKVNYFASARRTTGNQIVVGIDQNRLESRLRVKRFMDPKKFFPHRKPEWTVLSDYEIIMRYNYVIRGLINYYSPMVRDFSYLNKYIYILYYSCAHTIANKHKLSLRGVFKRYGHPITISQTSKKKKFEPPKKVIKLKVTKKRKDQKKLTPTEGIFSYEKKHLKTITLLDYKGCLEIYKELKESKALKRKPDIYDFLQVRINWRTVYKLHKYCVICGSSRKLQMHHNRHIRDSGLKDSGFKQVLSNLNRKQICVCESCHRKIHTKVYDGIKLADLYDPDLATV